MGERQSERWRTNQVYNSCSPSCSHSPQSLLPPTINSSLAPASTSTSHLNRPQFSGWWPSHAACPLFCMPPSQCIHWSASLRTATGQPHQHDCTRSVPASHSPTHPHWCIMQVPLPPALPPLLHHQLQSVDSFQCFQRTANGNQTNFQ